MTGFIESLFVLLLLPIKGFTGFIESLFELLLPPTKGLTPLVAKGFLAPPVPPAINGLELVPGKPPLGLPIFPGNIALGEIPFPPSPLLEFIISNNFFFF